MFRSALRPHVHRFDSNLVSSLTNSTVVAFKLHVTAARTAQDCIVAVICVMVLLCIAFSR